MSTAPGPTTPDARPTPPTDPPPVLRARDVRRSFPGGDGPVEVLRGVDLDVAPGEFLAVMGASGSGKSTLLYTLGGLDRPDSGTVALEGRDLTGLREKDLAALRLRRMGFVFQQGHFLDELDLRDNILLPALTASLPGAEERADGLLERFGLTGVAHHGATEVSGGQLQRASLCRALVGSPAVLLADEPTGALNAAMTAEVLAAFSEAHAAGTTIVLVTHDPGVASRADRVVYLEGGRVAGELPLAGHPDEERERTLRERLARLGF